MSATGTDVLFRGDGPLNDGSTFSKMDTITLGTTLSALNQEIAERAAAKTLATAPTQELPTEVDTQLPKTTGFFGKWIGGKKTAKSEANDSAPADTSLTVQTTANTDVTQLTTAAQEAADAAREAAAGIIVAAASAREEVEATNRAAMQEVEKLKTAFINISATLGEKYNEDKLNTLAQEAKTKLHAGNSPKKGFFSTDKFHEAAKAVVRIHAAQAILAQNKDTAFPDASKHKLYTDTSKEMKRVMTKSGEKLSDEEIIILTNATLSAPHSSHSIAAVVKASLLHSFLQSVNERDFTDNGEQRCAAETSALVETEESEQGQNTTSLVTQSPITTIQELADLLSSTPEVVWTILGLHQNLISEGGEGLESIIRATEGREITILGGEGFVAE
jgi:hypothetical protein